MLTHMLALPAAEAVRLLRAETDAERGQPELDTCAWKEYIIQERADVDLVTELSTLSIEPRVERDYWVLKVTVERALGPLRPEDEGSLARMDMTPDEFEAAFRSPGRKHVTVRLEVETTAARKHFDRWLADMRSRHPSAPAGRTRRKKAETGMSGAPASAARAAS